MLIILSLPGTWVIIAIGGLWAFFTDAANFGWSFFLPLIGLAAFGEVVEFAAGYFGAKRFGGSNKGSVGGMIGAIVGAIMFAPLFFGLGALFGALGGGYIGCFIVEKLCGASSAAAMRAALGATLGRFGGLVVKLGVAVTLIWLLAPRIWSSIGTGVAG